MDDCSCSHSVLPSSEISRKIAANCISLVLGSGLWMPQADKLALLREDIDRNSHRLKAVLTEKEIRHEIFDGISDDEEVAVAAFVNHNKESALKTKPKVCETFPCSFCSHSALRR